VSGAEKRPRLFAGGVRCSALRGEGRRLGVPLPILGASKTISRVLYMTVIYLGGLSPDRSSHLLEDGPGRPSCPPTVLLRIEFTAPDSFQPAGELLPRLSILTEDSAWPRGDRRCRIARCPSTGLLRDPTAVYFCCTFPEVAFGGRYPLSLPCGARTFLMTGLSALPRDCLAYSPVHFTGEWRACQENLLFSFPGSGIIYRIEKIWGRMDP